MSSLAIFAHLRLVVKRNILFVLLLNLITLSRKDEVARLSKEIKNMLPVSFFPVPPGGGLVCIMDCWTIGRWENQ